MVVAFWVIFFLNTVSDKNFSKNINSCNNNIKYCQNGCDHAEISLASDDVIWLKTAMPSPLQCAGPWVSQTKMYGCVWTCLTVSMLILC